MNVKYEKNTRLNKAPDSQLNTIKKKKRNSWSNANYPNDPRFPCSELIRRVNSLSCRLSKGLVYMSRNIKES